MTTKREKLLLILGTSLFCLQVISTPALSVIAAATIESGATEDSHVLQEEQETESSLSQEEITNDSEQEAEDTLENSSVPEKETTNPSEENTAEETEESYEEPSIQSSVSVSTWAQFRTAINNQSVTMINVTANISGNTSLNTINRNLTINGNGFTINSQGQQYNLTGANRQITVRNATITGTLTGNNAQFRSTTGASNTRFIFSDITFLGANRFVGPNGTVNDIFQTVIFDGGNSYFPDVNSINTLFVNVSDLRLANQAIVETNGRRFATSGVATSAQRTNELTVSVEEGAALTINDSPDTGIHSSSINIDGSLILSTLGNNAPIISGDLRTQPIQINIGSTAQVLLNRKLGQEPIFNLTAGAGGILSIARGAEFDFISTEGGPVISSGTNPALVNIESERLALWDLGLQNEEKASMVFSDVAIQLAGINGSDILSTNNERFQRLYDSAGLASYSRMSNRDVEEMDRFVTAHYEREDGSTLEESETLTGFLGDPYQSVAKEIPGYQLTTLPENASGEFSREAIQVHYVYQRVAVTPVDPLDPETEVDPENKPDLPEDQGLLSIDFASTFNFGSQAISAQEETYYAKPQRLLNEDGTVNENEERPNYIQISDRRPENERNGWQLAVTQNGQFETQDKEPLLGARLSFTNQALATAQGGILPELQQTNPLTLVPGVKRVLVMAQGDEGAGTWIYRFGDQEMAGESIGLTVPQGANPKAAQYKTSLTWELSAVPGNE